MTPQELSKMSDTELETYLNSAADASWGRQLAFQELTRRRLRSIAKGHWALTHTFWVIFATQIFAIIAAWPVIRGWFPG